MAQAITFAWTSALPTYPVAQVRPSSIATTTIRAHGLQTRLRADELERGDVVVTEETDGTYWGVLRRTSLKGSLVSLRIRGETDKTKQQRVQSHYAQSGDALAAELVRRLERTRKLTTRGPLLMLVATDVGKVVTKGGPAIERALAAHGETVTATLDALLARIRRET